MKMGKASARSPLAASR